MFDAAPPATVLGGDTRRINGLHLAEAPPCGLVTYRGDLADPRLAAALHSLLGLGVPAQGQLVRNGEAMVGWMSPDELLILTPRSDAGSVVAGIAQAMRGAHHLVLDLSDARTVLVMNGQGLRQVLAKVTPADLRLSSAPTGTLRRSRIGQVAAAMAFTAEGEVLVFCFRSVGRYVFDLLAQSAKDGIAV